MNTTEIKLRILPEVEEQFKAWCAMQNLSDADEALNALLLVILQSGLTFNYIADNFDDALFEYISPKLVKEQP